MTFYESYKGKKVVNIFYCGGASVVIIGALFKIMHFPGAGPLLMVGMCTEALLFAIGCFDKPHVDFHWQNVFPQLIGYGADPKELEELASKPRPTLLGSGCEGGTADAKKANVPALTDKEFEALKNSINDLAGTVAQLSELGKIAEKTNKLSEKMEAAGTATDKFISSQESITTASSAFAKNLENTSVTLSDKVNTATTTLGDKVNTAATTLGDKVNTAATALNEKVSVAATALNEKVTAASATLVKGVEEVSASMNKSAEAVAQVIGKQNTELTNAYAAVINQMQTIVNGSKTYEQQVGAINQKLTALNSVYELQINAAQSHAEAFKAQAEKVNRLDQTVEKIQTATFEAAKAGEEYQNAAKQLTKQVADLNKIYGNMLTALK